MTPIGIRENNPFDVSLPIEGWHGGGTVHGAPGQGGFASFPDMKTGFAAGVQRIDNYINTKHYKTISLMGEHYATDPRWADSVSKYSGIPLHAPLSTSDKEQMGQLYKGILLSELGPKYADPIIKEFISGKAAKPSPQGPIVAGTGAVLTGTGAVISYLQTAPPGQALVLVLVGVGLLVAALFARWKAPEAEMQLPAVVPPYEELAQLLEERAAFLAEIDPKIMAKDAEVKLHLSDIEKLLGRIPDVMIAAKAAPPVVSPPPK